MNLEQNKYKIFVLYPHSFSGLSIFLRAKKSLVLLNMESLFYPRVIEISKYINMKWIMLTWKY